MPTVNDYGFLEATQDAAQRQQQADDTATAWITGLRQEYERVSQHYAELFEELDRFPRNPRAEAKMKRLRKHMRRIKESIDLY